MFAFSENRQSRIRRIEDCCNTIQWGKCLTATDSSLLKSAWLRRYNLTFVVIWWRDLRETEREDEDAFEFHKEKRINEENASTWSQRYFLDWWRCCLDYVEIICVHASCKNESLHICISWIRLSFKTSYFSLRDDCELTDFQLLSFLKTVDLSIWLFRWSFYLFNASCHLIASWFLSNDWK